MPPPTRKELLAHASFVQNLARSLVKDEEAAKDIVQETWLTALRNPPRHTRNLRGWLRAVLFRVARASREGQRQRQRRERWRGQPESQPSTAEKVEREALFKRVVDAVLELGEPYQSVVLLRYFEGLPPRHIAERTGRPLNTVNSQLQRALDRLRDGLDDLYDHERSTWGAALVGLREGGAGRDAGAASRRPVQASSAAGVVGGVLSLSLGARLTLLALLALAVGASFWVWRGLEGPLEVAAAGPASSAVEPPASAALAAVPKETSPRSSLAAGVKRTESSESVGLDAVPELQPAEDERRLLVTVKDSAGRVVPGARVRVHSYAADREAQHPNVSKLRGRTDERGELSLSIIEDELGTPPSLSNTGQRAILVAEADGLVPSGLYHVLCPPGELTRVTLELGGPGLRVIGRVVDGAGLPVAGARVWTGDKAHQAREIAGGVLLTKPMPLVRTAADGSFTFEGEPQLRRQIFAAAEGFVAYAGWIDPKGAGEIERRIVLSSGGWLRGTVRKADGSVVVGAHVFCDQKDAEGLVGTHSDAQGSFELGGLRPWSQCRFWVQEHSSDGSVLQAQIRLDVGAGAELAWDPVLAPAPGTHLLLRDAEGAPLSGWLAFFELADTNDQWERVLTSDAQGRVSLYDRPQKTLRLSLYESSLQHGERGFPLRTLEIGAPDRKEQVITIAAQGLELGAIGGTLTDAAGRPWPEARVFAHPLEERDANQWPVDSSSGRFSGTDLPPGTYRLHVWCAGSGVAALGEYEVRAKESSEVGGLRTPELGHLEIDWKWKGAREGFTFQLLSFVNMGGKLRLLAVDEGRGAPALGYDLLPGDYGLEILQEGEILERRRLKVLAQGRQVVPTGPFGRCEVRVEVRAASSEALQAPIELKVLSLSGSEGASEAQVLTFEMGGTDSSDGYEKALLLPRGDYRFVAAAGDRSASVERELNSTIQVARVRLELADGG